MKETVGVSIDENILKQAKEAADDDRRSFSQYVEVAIVKKMEEDDIDITQSNDLNGGDSE